MEIYEIEYKITTNELNAAQVFTQMKQHIDAARNAALEEAAKVANRKLRGITPECNGYNRCSTETVEAIRALKGE